jgi:hypothetical protein
MLRSKTLELVEQESWGLLLAQFAIRRFMAQAAWPRGLDPDRLSYTHAVRVIKRKWPQAAAVPPERLTSWRDALLAQDRSGSQRQQPRLLQSARRQAQDEQFQGPASGRTAPPAA